MSRQLLGQVRQPLLNEDAISLQVVLDDLVQHTAMVKQAAVIRPDNTLFAQSVEAVPAAELASQKIFKQVLTLSSTANWQVQLSLDPGGIRQQLLTIFWSVSAVGLLFCALLLYWAQRLGHTTASRLQSLSACLPGSEATDGLDEISLLEKRIEPLLLKPAAEPSEAVETAALLESCCLAIRCTNLPQLQAHLSQDNLQRVFKRFDDIIAATGELFKAERLSGSKNCVYLRFTAAAGDSHYLLRAISSHLALAELQREQASDEGAALILSAALSVEATQDVDTVQQSCQFIEDSRIETAQQQLAATSLLAAPWQLLINATTKTKIPAEAGIFVEALAGASTDSASGNEAFLFTDLGAEQQALFERQLAYLRNQLSENDQPHWQHSPTGNALISAVAS